MTNIVGPHGPGIQETTARPTDTSSGNPLDTWFAPCLSGDPNSGTRIPAVWLNKVTALFRRAIRGVGVPEAENDDDMLLACFQKVDRAIANLGSGAGVVGLYKGKNTGGDPLLAGRHEFYGLVGAGGIRLSVDNLTGLLTINGANIEITPPGSTHHYPVGTIPLWAFVALGGTGPYVFTVQSGSTPAGVTLQSSGSFTGSFTTPGTYTATIRATDATGAWGEATYKWVVPATTFAVSPASGTFTIPVGTVPIYPLTSSGSTGPYTYTVVSGSLPTGVAMNPDGTFSGSFTTAGVFSAVIFSTSATAEVSAVAYTWVVGDGGAGSSGAAVLTISPPGGLYTYPVGTAFAYPLQASGGTAPYTWEKIAGTLPTGISAFNANGSFTGACSAAGTFTAQVRVTDAKGLQATATYSWIIT